MTETETANADTVPQAWQTESVFLDTPKGRLCMQTGLVPHGKREHPLEAKLVAMETERLGVLSLEYEAFINLFDNQQVLVAGAQLQRKWNSCKLYSLWVDDDFRKLGIGAHILQVAEELCLNMGAEVLLLETSTMHNVDFYLRRGFSVVGELLDVIPGETFFILHKNLLTAAEELNDAT